MGPKSSVFVITDILLRQAASVPFIGSDQFGLMVGIRFCCHSLLHLKNLQCRIYH